MNKEDERIILTEKQLEILRMYKSFRVPKAKLRQDFDIDFNQIRYTFEAELVADKLSEEFYTDYFHYNFPKTSWQMFKSEHESSWWLGWLVRRRPVEYEHYVKTMKVKLDRYFTYPAMELDRKMGSPVKFERITRVE